jgi:hypothetical protein
MKAFLPNPGSAAKITAKFKSKVFSFAGQTSSASAQNPAPFGTDYTGASVNDSLPNTVFDPVARERCLSCRVRSPHAARCPDGYETGHLVHLISDAYSLSFGRSRWPHHLHLQVQEREWLRSQRRAGHRRPSRGRLFRVGERRYGKRSTVATWLCRSDACAPIRESPCRSRPVSQIRFTLAPFFAGSAS